MLVEAELLSESGHIIPAVLSERVAALLSDAYPERRALLPNAGVLR